ncbi:MAG: helix-turn-helix transcriptional regulator [Methyloprofundus sp.]|nr:helix-turn-helix transcriptional regulator [Methyloprofundus sp.]
MKKPSSKIIAILSENILRLRTNIGLSQEELAFKSGLHRTYIGAVERGERNITISSLELIANALDVKLTTLLEKEDN